MNTAYTLDLSTIFMDGNSDALDYAVKVDSADYVDADESYSYTPSEAGDTVLTFKANDGIADSTETYVVTLTAEELKYTVSFDSQGGSDVDDITDVVSGSTISAPADPTLEGYDFAGWYKEAECTNAWDFATDTVTDDTTLYAKWTPRDDTAYVVEHYWQNIGDDDYTLHETDDLTGTTGTTATAVAKVYAGLTENTTHASRVASGTIAGDGSLVLALYYDRDTHTVSFDSQGGSDVDDITGVRYDATISAPADPTQTGYDFAGWYKESACTNAWDFATDTVTDDTTLYADWTPRNDTPYTIKHYKQDAEGDGYTLDMTIPCTGTTGTTVSAVPQVYDHFTENTTHPSRVQSATLLGDGSLVLALYYDRDTHTVSFDSQGGSDVDDITGVRYDATISAPTDPTQTGYDFAGWYKEAECTNAWDFDTDTVTDDTTLYAKWTPATNTPYHVEYYRQNVDDDDYSLHQTDRITGTTGATVYAVIFEITGFTENATHPSRVPSGVIAADGSLVLKIYYDRDTYTVSFDSQGGSDVDDIENVKYGAKIAEPTAPTRAGFLFVAWYTEVECTTEWDFATDTVEDNMTLYADWVVASDVTLNPNGGDGFAENTTTYEEGHVFNLPNEDYVGEREGYVPTGWNTLADGSGTHYDFEAEFTVPEDDTTLYVEWDSNYTITYNLCGGTNDESNPANYVLGDTPITLNDPTKDGYDFAGWYDNANYTGAPITEIAEGSTGNKEFWARWASSEIVNGKLIETYYRSGGTIEWKYVYNGTTTESGIKNRCKYNASEVLTEITSFDESDRRTTLTKYYSNGKAQYKYFYDVTTGNKKSMMSYAEDGTLIAKTEYYENGLSAKRQYLYYASGKKKIIKNYRTNKNLSSQTWFYYDGISKKQFNTYDANGNLTSVSKYYMNGTRYYYKKY